MAAWVNNQRLIGPGRARCCVVYTCLPLVTQMCGAPVYLYIFYNKRASWRGDAPPLGYRSGSFAGSNKGHFSGYTAKKMFMC